MPVFFHSPISQPEIATLAATTVRGLTLFARRGPKDRLLLSLQQKIHPQGFGMYDEYTSEERTDADPAVGTLGDDAFVAWKSPKGDRVNFARVLVEEAGWNSKVLGLADKETFEPPMRGPLTLVPQGDRFLLGHTTEGGAFAFASVVPFDKTFTDPLPQDSPGCELCAVTSDDEFYLTSEGETWNKVGRFSGKPRIKLPTGWLPLLLTLKEGQPDVYSSGDASEWQGVLGDQVYWDELTEETEPEDEADRQVLHHLAISGPDDVTRYAEALGKITKARLRKRYDKLAKLVPGKRLSVKEFNTVWGALEELVGFLRSVAGKDLHVVHRALFPVVPPPPLPKVGKVKVKLPSEKQLLAQAAPGVLDGATESFGVHPTSETDEWPFNVLSQQMMPVAGGRITRFEEDNLGPDAGPEERRRVFEVAAEAEARFARLPIRTVDFNVLQAFRVVADQGTKPPKTLTPEHVRAAFRGTLHPFANIEIQSAREFGAEALGGGEVQLYGYRIADVKMHNRIWADNMDWFESHPDLTGRAWYVSVEGGGLNGCMAVRLIVGMTRAGSLAGVCTVGLGSGLTRTLEPRELYTQLRDAERKEFEKWLDPATGRMAARAVFRTYDPEQLRAWNEQTQAAAKKMKAKDRPAFWLAEFAKLTPVRTLSISPAWEAIQRCITNGRLASYPEPEVPLFFGTGWDGLGEIGLELGFYSYQGDRLLKIANWLSAHPTRWLRERYDDLRATGYAGINRNGDKQTVTDAYEAVKEFYLQAAEKYAVVVEITTKRDLPASGGPSSPSVGCQPTNDMLAPLLPCMETYGVDDEREEWPHNDLSTKLVRYTCGNIAREGEWIPHAHDPAEVERIRTLAAEAEKRLAELVPPHDQGGPYLAFFSAANTGEPVPEAFTPEFVRDRLFRGTAHPEGDISVEPLTAERVWYYDGAKATGFVDWFRAQPGLHGFAFVKIGVSEDVGGACHPRLAVALTDKGSVVGVCGYVVWA